MVMEPLTPRSEREVIPLRNKLVQYFSAEDVEYRCEKCKKPGGKATKRITVRSGPEFLIVNIARHKPAKFAWKKGAKVRNHVSFHEKLSLPETPASGKRKLAHYKLQAVLAHAGSTMSGGKPSSYLWPTKAAADPMTAGHYISYVQQPDGTWAECNDDSVGIRTWPLSRANVDFELGNGGFPQGRPLVRRWPFSGVRPRLLEGPLTSSGSRRCLAT